MGNNNNKKEINIGDKMEIKDEVKVTELHEEDNKKEEEVKIEEKKPEVNVKVETPKFSPTQKAPVVSDKNKEYSDEINKLESSIKEWSTKLERSQNSINSAILSDNIFQARKRIEYLKDLMNPLVKEVKDCNNVPKVSDGKPEETTELWKFSL